MEFGGSSPTLRAVGLRLSLQLGAENLRLVHKLSIMKLGLADQLRVVDLRLSLELAVVYAGQHEDRDDERYHDRNEAERRGRGGEFHCLLHLSLLGGASRRALGQPK